MSLKIVYSLLRNWQTRVFNKTILRQCTIFQPDLVLVYKGTFVLKSTIKLLKKKGTPVVVFHPDVSFLTHGSNIPECLPLYDHVFTTKTFAAKDLKYHFNFPPDRVSFIPHGFDPQVHRTRATSTDLSCDVSFIGGPSKSKIAFLESLVKALPGLDLKIWGGGWQRYEGKVLTPHIVGQPIYGDVYASAINGSKINLGLLSEQVKGASSGDLITSRTFHIPGAGGFMLHQRTVEIGHYFEESKEAAFFDGPEELIEKVHYYLDHPKERSEIAENGKARAERDHTLDVRAKRLLSILEEQNLLALPAMLLAN